MSKSIVRKDSMNWKELCILKPSTSLAKLSVSKGKSQFFLFWKEIVLCLIKSKIFNCILF